MRILPQLILPVVLTTVAAAQNKVDIYSTKELGEMTQDLAQKGTQFASKDLERYKGHYTILAHREATGSSEVHEHEADIFFITAGQAVMLYGGKLVNPKTQKAGEIRGTSVEGGEKRTLGTGDVIHIPAGVPHQMLVTRGRPVTYFVVKVTGQ